MSHNHHHFFLEEKTETIVSSHHRHPQSLPIQEVRQNVCSKVRDSLEYIGVATCNGCDNICITK